MGIYQVPNIQRKRNGEFLMTCKTIFDCAKCHKMSYCNAHITNGTWDHRNTDDPCEVSFGEPIPDTYKPTTNGAKK